MIAVPRIVPFGDAALLVELEGGLDPLVNARALAIADAIRADREGPWGVPIPSYDAVIVPYDPLRIDDHEATRDLSALVGGLSDALPVEPGPIPLIEIPVRYGGEDGPDLVDVAARLGLRPLAVVELHASVEYRVFFLGFAPGFGYLGPLPEALRLPRRPEPRTRVPPGSVAIAGAQTGVYPGALPGGWHLIGRTSTPTWDLARIPPALFRPGERVRFVPERSA